MNTESVMLSGLDHHKRGIDCERRALNALEVMARHGEGIIELKTPPVVGFRPGRGNRQLERKGVDAVATLKGGCEIPIQVKSSARGKRRFERNHKMRAAHGWFVTLTEAVIIDPHERLCTVIQKLSEYINRAYHAVQRFIGNVRRRHRSRSRWGEVNGQHQGRINYFGCRALC